MSVINLDITNYIKNDTSYSIVVPNSSQPYHVKKVPTGILYTNVYTGKTELSTSYKPLVVKDIYGTMEVTNFEHIVSHYKLPDGSVIMEGDILTDKWLEIRMRDEVFKCGVSQPFKGIFIPSKINTTMRIGTNEVTPNIRGVLIDLNNAGGQETTEHLMRCLTRAKKEGEPFGKLVGLLNGELFGGNSIRVEFDSLNGQVVTLRDSGGTTQEFNIVELLSPSVSQWLFQPQHRTGDYLIGETIGIKNIVSTTTLKVVNGAVFKYAYDKRTPYSYARALPLLLIQCNLEAEQAQAKRHHFGRFVVGSTTDNGEYIVTCNFDNGLVIKYTIQQEDSSSPNIEADLILTTGKEIPFPSYKSWISNEIKTQRDGEPINITMAEYQDTILRENSQSLGELSQNDFNMYRIRQYLLATLEKSSTYTEEAEAQISGIILRKTHYIFNKAGISIKSTSQSYAYTISKDKTLYITIKPDYTLCSLNHIKETKWKLSPISSKTKPKDIAEELNYYLSKLFKIQPSKKIAIKYKDIGTYFKDILSLSGIPVKEWKEIIKYDISLPTGMTQVRELLIHNGSNTVVQYCFITNDNIAQEFRFGDSLPGQTDFDIKLHQFEEAFGAYIQSMSMFIGE